MQQLKQGQRIYNHGDMANPPHFGKVISDDNSRFIVIQEDGAEDTYTIPISMIDSEFKGHSGTRIVTEKAYEQWRNKTNQKTNQVTGATERPLSKRGLTFAILVDGLLSEKERETLWALVQTSTRPS